VRDWLYAIAPYDKGSDHDVLLNSRFAIPSLFFFNWPHRFYHTDYDTPEKLDADEFTRTGVVAGTMALVPAMMGSEIAHELLALIKTEALHGLARLDQHSDPGTQIADAHAHHLRLLAQAEMEDGAMSSLMLALPPHERADFYGSLSHASAALVEWLDRKDAIALEEDARIPVRVEAWPVNMGQVAKSTGKERLATLRTNVVDFDDKAIAALNYATGWRNLGQIARLVAGELGDFTLTQTVRWFELLAESGVVIWSEKESHPFDVGSAGDPYRTGMAANIKT
jgi:hypothetical protein